MEIGRVTKVSYKVASKMFSMLKFLLQVIASHLNVQLQVSPKQITRNVCTRLKTPDKCSTRDLLANDSRRNVQNARDGLQQKCQHVEYFTCGPLISRPNESLKFRTVFTSNLRIS